MSADPPGTTASNPPPAKRAKKNKPPAQPTITKRGTVVGQLSEQIADSNDPAVKPYGCGYPQCQQQQPPVQFNNCGMLLAHWRDTHENFRGSIERPFLCTMDGCLRDWKVCFASPGP
ncbi:hypothetical protein PtA15_4A556 [Puccinia triticina]|uniref:C2H2-type domain-containing protein n=1 Tax=Puccinia triticina TaxID=208348 RepID=A0ABY7CH71_9BASI|nr:uncharacterized protein PtA15_4A556 [Puccinia triticina]WAQ84105.1 hypothetical protein PtA15_4A556 [Puccinia triticina]